MTFWVLAWLRAFALTVAVELVVAVPLLAPAEPRRGRRVATVALANLATHPLVWFAFPGLALGTTTRVLSSELWAVAGEAAIYLLVWPAAHRRRVVLVSLVANAASVMAGLGMTWLARR